MESGQLKTVHYVCTCGGATFTVIESLRVGSVYQPQEQPSSHVISRSKPSLQNASNAYSISVIVCCAITCLALTFYLHQLIQLFIIHHNSSDPNKRKRSRFNEDSELPQTKRHHGSEMKIDFLPVQLCFSVGNEPLWHYILAEKEKVRPVMGNVKEVDNPTQSEGPLPQNTTGDGAQVNSWSKNWGLGPKEAMRETQSCRESQASRSCHTFLPQVYRRPAIIGNQLILASVTKRA